MDSRTKRRKPIRVTDTNQEKFSTGEKRFPQQGPILENETLDEYWKRLVDIERQCEFNNITAEEIITYKFAAIIKDKRARDNVVKGPLKIQLVLETIELDSYN